MQQKNKSGSLQSSSQPETLIRTGALPHINSSIIQTANSQLLANSQTNSQLLANSQVNSQLLANSQTNSQLPGKLPLSLSSLLSPRHAPCHAPLSSALPLSPARHTSSQPSLVPPSPDNRLCTPVRMMPASFSPSGPAASPPKVSGSGLVYLRQDQNIPENFCDKFRPIEPANQRPGEPVLTNERPGKTESVDIKNISSDDIVVTLHSVNV